ncbi:glycosyltransferase family 4 protein [Vibrio sp. BS-M-Sm-2]|uniref:glycosyltransferase family 4 protein n=1 Tax=Vibrio sp. BS-M-Sm-2 TaxID=3241167 RepID=UPI00390C6775
MNNNYKEIAYIHDFCFYKNKKGTCYTAVGMPEKYFDRFFESGFEQVKIYSRSKVKNEKFIQDIGFNKIKNKSILIPLMLKNYAHLLSPRVIRSLIIEFKRADLLVINFPSIIGLYSWILNLISKTPYTLEVAADADQFSQKKFGGIVTRIFKWIFPRIVNSSQGGIYVSKYLLEQFPHPNGTVASNVIVNSIKPLETKNYLKYTHDSKKYKILFVGGVNKRKGVSTLIEAMEILVSKGYDNISLDIVGGHNDLDYKSIVKSKGLGDKIFFRGILSASELRHYFESANLYVQPSFAEGIPRATLEAMSYNIPILATRLPGFREVLEEICLFDSGDSNSLSLLIESVLNCEHNIMRTVEINNKKISEYTVDKLHSKRIEFYRGLNV